MSSDVPTGWYDRLSTRNKLIVVLIVCAVVGVIAYSNRLDPAERSMRSQVRSQAKSQLDELKRQWTYEMQQVQIEQDRRLNQVHADWEQRRNQARYYQRDYKIGQINQDHATVVLQITFLADERRREINARYGPLIRALEQQQR